MIDELKKEKLFQDGFNYYKIGDYFEAHESWEELWSDYYLEDRKFIQGLIQLAVSFVHLERCNLIGARNLLIKSKEKMQAFSGIHRGINMDLLLKEIGIVESNYDQLEDLKDFDWTMIPSLK